MTGTLGTSTGRYEVITKGPLTGAIAASNSGGMFGSELKFAGSICLFLKAHRPTGVSVYEDGKAELRDASHLWGKFVFETTDMLLNETASTAKVACIGPPEKNFPSLPMLCATKNARRTFRSWCRNGIQKTQSYCGNWHWRRPTCRSSKSSRRGVEHS
jgi:aldehyde:ferredoxin oxidoreductase